MKKTKIAAILFAGLLISTLAIAGHYHGHGGMMPTWDMGVMDADGNGSLTFDEYMNPIKEKMRGGFDMIDENNDGEIGADEWQKLLEVHGMSTSS